MTIRFNYPHLHSWDHFGVAHAVLSGNLLFISGVMALDREGVLVGAGDVKAQTEYVFEAIRQILKQHSATMRDLVKVTTYFVGPEDFETIAETRTRFYAPEQRPASSTVRVCGLPRPDALIEG